MRDTALIAIGRGGGEELFVGLRVFGGDGLGVGFEEALDGVEDGGAVFGFEDLFAEGAAAGDSVSEPAGELFHFADTVAVALLAGDLA